MLARSSIRSSRVLLGGGLAVAAAGKTALHLQQDWQEHSNSIQVTACDAALSTAPLLSSSSSSSLIIPTMQATARASRLVATSLLIVSDYYIPNGSLIQLPSSVTTAMATATLKDSSQSNDDLEYWEQELERREEALYRAQTAYTKPSDSDATVHQSDWDPKGNLKQDMTRAAEELAEAQDTVKELAGPTSSRKSVIHRRAANRLLQLCRKNGGVYIKVGQHLAQLDYLIPEEYTEVLSSLFDDTPETDYEDVRQVVREELGKDPEELFDNFDHSPIASASLAQVHVAYDKETGRKLAIKIQHRGLRETSAGDIFALTTMVRVAESLFESFNWGWIATEIAPHLPRELDFLNEGKNAERAAANLQKTGLACVVPKVRWTHSSPRVLTMEFEEGFKATDIDAIEKAGLKKHDVAKLISSIFSSQVFLSAFVHCDPHPANVLLRADKKGKPEVVLVDHGLYRELNPDFQLRYSKLWKSLMLADLNGIKDACQSLGVGEAYTLFAAMLTARPFDEIIERSKKGSLSKNANPDSSADKAVIRAYVNTFIQKIFGLLDTMPREMLLLLKMNDCLRHIDYSLGSPTNTIVVCGEYAARAVYADNLRQNPSFLGVLRAWIGYMQVMARIQAHDLGVWWLEQKRNAVLRLS
jgi:aarF domain-containing kinase